MSEPITERPAHHTELTDPPVGRLGVQSLQQWIIHRLADETDVDINATTSIKTLGLDSLILIGLAGELAELVEIELPAEIMWEKETPAAISKYIVEQAATTNITTSQIDSINLETTTNTYFAVVASKSLVRPIRASGSQTPLFLFHVATGRTTPYVPLVDLLDEDQPVFGVNALQHEPSNTIEAVVATYLDDIRKVQRKGPYRLGGYCFGGIVAFEAAQQLRAIGEQVELLCMIDSLPPNLAPTGLQDFIKETGSKISDIARLPLQVTRNTCNAPKTALHDLTSWIIKNTTTRVKKLTQKIGLSNKRPVHRYGHASQAIQQQLHGASEMLASYRPQPYDGDITLLLGTLWSAPRVAPLRWRKIVTGNVRVFRVFAPHEMLREPYLSKIAEHFQSCLKSSN